MISYIIFEDIKMAKKEQQEEQSAFESSEALAEQISRGEEFVEKNKNIITYVLVGIVALIAGFFWLKTQNEEAESDAQAEMFNAQFYFEADSLTKAMEGDGNSLGFLDIIDMYSGTKAANLSNFYAGVISMKKGEFDEAIAYLNEFSSSDLLIQARAYSLIGDCNSEAGEMAEAITFYKKAANYEPNEQFTPSYLMKLALAQEAESDFEGAIASYTTIIKDFPAAQEVNDAKKRKARASGL